MAIQQPASTPAPAPATATALRRRSGFPPPSTRPPAGKAVTTSGPRLWWDSSSAYRRPDRGPVPGEAARGIIAIGFCSRDLPGQRGLRGALHRDLRRHRQQDQHVRDSLTGSARGLCRHRVGHRGPDPYRHRAQGHQTGLFVMDWQRPEVLGEALERLPRSHRRDPAMECAALERIADALPRRSSSRTWPMLGMLALGLVAGAAIGGYAMSRGLV